VNKYILLALALIGCSNINAQPLRMVAQPNYPPQQASRVYQPLADYIGDQVGRDVILVTPRSFQHHWLDTRRGESFDLALEDAPITDFRIQRQNFVPLVRVAEAQSYTLCVADPNYESVDDLVGVSIATMPAPSTGYLILVNWFPNPLRQPNIRSRASRWQDAVQDIFAYQTEAAIAPKRLVDQYPQLTRIRTSDPVPGPAISASAELTPELRQAIRAALLTLNESERGVEILEELNTSELVPASAEEYSGYIEWLRRVSSF